MTQIIGDAPAHPALTPRERDILNIVDNYGGMSRNEIAQALRLKKHPQLITTIERLVAQGDLLRSVTTTRNGSPCYIYTIGVIP